MFKESSPSQFRIEQRQPRLIAGRSCTFANEVPLSVAEALSIVLRVDIRLKSDRVSQALLEKSLGTLIAAYTNRLAKQYGAISLRGTRGADDRAPSCFTRARRAVAQIGRAAC